MVSSEDIAKVDALGMLLRARLLTASEGEWGVPFEFGPAPNSDYWRAKIEPRLNWIQLNGSVYDDPSYDRWKIHARFTNGPDSDLWEEAPPYEHNRSPRHWVMSGDNVWAISYAKLAEELEVTATEDVFEEILVDLKSTWREICSSGG